MFKSNTTKQTSLFSTTDNWNNYQKRRIEKTWVKWFKENIFQNIDEESFKVLYSNDYSRPNTPVNIIIGLLIIKELLNLTDEETMDCLAFDTRIQYSLDTLDEQQQGSENTLNLFRRRLNEYYSSTGIDLLENELKRINTKIVELSKIDTKFTRIDSLMISSSCKRLNRIELVYEVNKNLVKVMKNNGYKIKGFRQYLDEKQKANILYKTKSQEENGKLNRLLKDSITLHNRLKTNEKINNTKEFKQLERMIDDQYDKNKKEAKSNNEIKPTSLQTPYDEEATYRFKYGNNTGYVGNIEELVEVNNDKNKVLIKNWDVSQNVTSDKEFMEKYINNKNDEQDETAIVDSAYFSDELNKMAKSKNIEMHPTELVARKVKDNLLNEFELDKKTNKIISCPAKEKALISEYDADTGKIRSVFDINKCNNCPLKNQCATHKSSKNSILYTTLKTYERAIENKKMSSEDYQKISNIRAGIEGIPSILRRKYNIDKRHGKGLVRLKIKYGCSMIAINIKRMVKIEQNA